MFDFITYPFMLRALAAGLLTGFLSSYFGVFVVQRGMSFLGDGLAHAAFGGVALGLLLGSEPLWIAIPFTVLVSIAITWVKKRTEISIDTAIGVFFSVSAALGIIFISLKHEFSADAYSYLFGSILAVSNLDLLVVTIVTILTLVLLPLWKHWSYASFDRELALADHHSVDFHDYLLSVMTAVTVVISVKVVGIILIAASLVIPAAASKIVSASFKKMTVISVLIGMLSIPVGLFISYHLDVPSGAVIILVQALCFGLFTLKLSLR